MLRVTKRPKKDLCSVYHVCFLIRIWYMAPGSIVHLVPEVGDLISTKGD